MTRITPADIEAAVSQALLDSSVRIGAILRSPEAKGREQMALSLALESTLSADAAIRLMSTAPKASTNADRFLLAMEREGNLGIDSSGAQPRETDTKAKRLAEIRAVGCEIRKASPGAFVSHEAD